VSLRGDDVQVHLLVENTGPSIPQELMNSLFEPLRRHVQTGSQGERESLGLGLFIVRQVALAHGGSVTVDSADGRTRFTVTLPKNFGFDRQPTSASSLNRAEPAHAGAIAPGPR
jgi:signal transduction histidine kinase